MKRPRTTKASRYQDESPGKPHQCPRCKNMVLTYRKTRNVNINGRPTEQYYGPRHFAAHDGCTTSHTAVPGT